MSRTLVILAVIISLCRFAGANELDSTLAPNGQMEATRRLAAARHKDLVLLGVGVALSVVGIVLTSVGALYLVKSIGSDNNDSQTKYFNIGLPTLLVGQAAALAGIPLWIVGQVRASKAQRAMLHVSASGASLMF